MRHSSEVQWFKGDLIESRQMNDRSKVNKELLPGKEFLMAH